jgi:hypothetical protein
MAAKLTRLTHKIAIQLQRAVPFAVLAPCRQSGNFWIQPRMRSLTGTFGGVVMYNLRDGLTVGILAVYRLSSHRIINRT